MTGRGEFQSGLPARHLAGWSTDAAFAVAAELIARLESSPCRRCEPSRGAGHLRRCAPAPRSYVTWDAETEDGDARADRRPLQLQRRRATARRRSRCRPECDRRDQLREQGRHAAQRRGHLRRGPIPNSASDPAIPRAYTEQGAGGAAAGSHRRHEVHRRRHSGKYRIFCGVPGHGSSGMWIWMNRGSRREGRRASNRRHPDGEATVKRRQLE